MKKITKEKLDLINCILVEMALVEINILDSNRYFKLASKIQEDQEVRITEEETTMIFECIYKYIKYNKVMDIDNYMEMIRELIGIS